MKMTSVLKLIGFWPPYLGAGVRVTKISPDVRSVEVEMKLRFWNRNYVRTHFGGSLYSMVDPFLMLMLIENLGPDYIVWDKAATIRFKKPGRDTVRARFSLTQERLDEIRSEVARLGKYEPVFHVQVTQKRRPGSDGAREPASDDEIVAEVEKTLYIRKK